MKYIKRALSALICMLILVVSLCCVVSAVPLPDTSAAGAVSLYCLENHQFVYTVNADAEVYPASTVKIMTAILAIEHYTDRYDEVITVNGADLYGVYGNHIGLSDGEQLTAEQLIASVIVGNANDSATVLAIEISGSVDTFVEKMNEKARELGAVNTHYTNPTGMHSAAMTTTARDVALISSYAYSMSKFTEYSAVAKYQIPKTDTCQARTVHNKNYFTSTWINPDYYDSSISGLNAGATDEAGCCVVASKYQDGLTFICVVMNASYGEEDNTYYSYVTADEMFSWVKKYYSFVTVLDSSSIMCEIPVTMSSQTDYVTLLPESSVELFLPSDVDISNDVHIDWVLDSESLTAPVASGTVVGIATVTYDNTIVGRVNLVTKNSVESDTVMYVLTYLRAVTSSVWFKLGVIFLFVAAVSYVLIVARIRFLRKKHILVNNSKSYFTEYRREENQKRDDKMRGK